MVRSDRRIGMKICTCIGYRILNIQTCGQTDRQIYRQTDNLATTRENCPVKASGQSSKRDN